ncbi:MAG: hypothetical protein HY566_00050 [Candidatus Kerfeldbacteria bacterium]|nr:hypothetical protein [Candidatus Kerfeldbacteria bacterium]
MERIVLTFRATPCGGGMPQLFRAAYDVEEVRTGIVRWQLVPGTLEQRTSLGVEGVEQPSHQDEAQNIRAAH